MHHHCLPQYIFLRIRISEVVLNRGRERLPGMLKTIMLGTKHKDSPSPMWPSALALQLGPLSYPVQPPSTLGLSTVVKGSIVVKVAMGVMHF